MRLPAHVRCQAEVRRLREAPGRVMSSKLDMQVRGQIVAEHVERLRARIPDPSRLSGVSGDAASSRLAEPSGDGSPEAATPTSGLALRITEAQATVAGVQNFVIDESAPMVGKLAKCVDTLAGVGTDAAAAGHQARAVRDQHQRLRFSTATVYEELRTGLEAVPPALGFSRTELAPLLLMGEEVIPTSRGGLARGLRDHRLVPEDGGYA